MYEDVVSRRLLNDQWLPLLASRRGLDYPGHQTLVACWTNRIYCPTFHHSCLFCLQLTLGHLLEYSVNRPPYYLFQINGFGYYL